jgi:predicted nucleic acid-binding protein
MSIWDALIWSVANSNNVSIILTEDMPHRTSISGVLYQNPFSSDFELAALLAMGEGS